MRVFLVNPSHVSFGTAVIIPRWLWRARRRNTASLEHTSRVRRNAGSFDFGQLAAGDVAGIGIHTGNALRGA